MWLVPTKDHLKLSSDMAMLFALLGCTHPPPRLAFFAHADPKNIAGNDVKS